MSNIIEGSCIPRIPRDLIEGTVEGYRYFLNPEGHHGVLVLFGDALDVLQGCKSAKSVDALRDSITWARENPTRFMQILTSLGEKEMVYLGNEFSQYVRVTRKRKKKQMMAWMQLTDACNLCCGYCYIQKKSTRMGLPLAKQLVSAIVRDCQKAGFEEVVFKLAGGEPTLFWSDGKSLIDWANATFKLPTLQVRFHIITNGTLLHSSLVEYIRSEKIGLSLSLDGIGEWHDKQRHYRNGKGSFRRVDRNLELLLKAGISPYILTTVTNENVGGLTELARYCIERNLGFRFSFYREVVSPTDGLANDDVRLILELKRCYAWIGEHLPRRSLYSCHRFGDMNLQSPKVRGCGIGINGITVASDGQVSTCQYVMSNPLGSALEENSVSLITDEGASHLEARHVDKILRCQECKWRYICGGACSFLTKLHYGTFQHPSPYCAVYQAILPVLAELHALQLIREFQQKGGEKHGTARHTAAVQ